MYPLRGDWRWRDEDFIGNLFDVQSKVLTSFPDTSKTVHKVLTETFTFQRKPLRDITIVQPPISMFQTQRSQFILRREISLPHFRRSSKIWISHLMNSNGTSKLSHPFTFTITLTLRCHDEIFAGLINGILFEAFNSKNHPALVKLIALSHWKHKRDFRKKLIKWVTTEVNSCSPRLTW